MGPGPELAPEFPCASYHPKQSDLVLTGAAESRFRHPSGVQFDSEAQVLQTAQMVALDWQRTVSNSAVLPCLGAALAKQAGPNEKLVSMAERPFPKFSTYTRAYRALIDVTASARRIRIMVDLVLVGRNRTELTLSTTAPYAAHAAIEPAEVHLARALVARVKA